MKALKLLSTTAIALIATSASAQVSGLQLGLMGGYAGGLSGQVYVQKANVAGPIGVRLSAAVTRPSDNIVDSVDIANGSPISMGTFATAKTTLGASESGSRTVLGLDGTYSLGEVAPGVTAGVYAGGRYGMFSATENYSSTNTSTTYSMNSFGVGAGVTASYPLSGNLRLVGDLGVDQFFNGSINMSGSNTDSYSTSDSGYSGLRERLAFPGTVLKAQIGVQMNLGY